VRVNANRLDIGSLRDGERCSIATGTSSISLIHGGQSIDMGIYLNGVGSRPLSDPDLMTQEGGVHWLHLNKLAPRKLYTVLSSNGGSGGQIRDDTPSGEPPAEEVESGGRSWSALARLLGSRRG
jgi:hypothetical protein